MSVYDIQELPSINDPGLIRNCVCVQEMRSTLIAFLKHVLSQLTSTAVTAPVRVILAIVNRLAEAALSIELLCQKNLTRDAAILLLSLHELRLDLQYIARDQSRADIWLDHTKENQKPWRVTRQIKEIYIVPHERDAELEIYRKYSMVKHCNPVGENFAFGVAAKRDFLLVDCGGNSPLVRVHLLGLGGHIHIAVVAAASILAIGGLDVDGYADRIHDQWRRLSRYNEEHILSVLEGL